jgi:F0F1-type ATP synthase membrane subunit b/b'
MGQAKARGSFEKRKAEGIIRNAEEQLQRLEEERIRDTEREVQRIRDDAKKTPEQRKRSRLRASQIAAIHAGIGVINVWPRTPDKDFD